MSETNRPTAGEVEERTAGASADGKRVHGLVPYGVKASLGRFTEEIARDALRDTKLDGLVAVIDHEDRGLPLARYPRSLQVEHRDDGLAWSFEPPKSRADVVEAIERGDVAGSSWRMRVAEDRWDGDHRTITRIAELRDITLAGSQQPVYPTNVEYRTQHDGAEGRQKENTMETSEERSSQEEQRGGLQVEDRRVTQDDEKRHEVTSYPAGSLRVEDRTADVDIRFRSLAEAYAERGYFENRAATVGWDEFRSFTWSAGTVLTDLNPLRREGYSFGYDQRWLYPVLPTTAVSDATTAVQYLRQSARTLAGTAVIRPLDAVTTKPETSTTVEYQTLQLQQVASIQSNIPRIHSLQPMFQTLVEQDLRYSINDGLDEIARRGLALAGTIVKGSDDILEVTRKAMTLVQANGYSPNTLAIDPAGAQSLDLLRTPGTEKMYIFAPGQFAGAPWGLQVRVWKTAGTAVLDANAYGRMYISPVELRAFEQDAGATNRQTVRMECAAGYTAERLTAARRIT